MPALKNAKHEAFAQGLFKGLTVDKAYSEAGFKANRGNATRLKANENIQARLDELQSKASEKAEWSAADRLAALKRISDAAEDKDPRVAVSAIGEANKMQGSHAPAKHTHSGAIGTYDLTKLSEDELDRLESILGPLALAGGDQSGEGEARG
jgi:phage terminase small subunit